MPHFTGDGLLCPIKRRKSLLLYWEISMRDRRENARDKVIYGGVAEIGETGASRECIVRNISDKGASVEFSNVVNLPREQMSLRIARKGRSFLAKVVWWRDNFVGLAFSAEPPSEPVSDLGERLRKSEIKKRQLQRRIKELLGER
jgi:PilZ domain-containing protein